VWRVEGCDGDEQGTSWCVAACRYLRVQAKMTFAGRGTAAEIEEASICKEASENGRVSATRMLET
jgi:hypothetical protein